MADATLKEPWVRLLHRRFLEGMAGLSPAERGVYFTLCCLMYDADGPIEHDEKRLARHCGCTVAVFRKLRDELIRLGKITANPPGHLWNRRAALEISDRAARTGRARHAAESRWTQEGEKSQQNQQNDDADASPEHPAGHPLGHAASTLPCRATDLTEETKKEEDDDDDAGAQARRNKISSEEGRGAEQPDPPLAADPELSRIREAARVAANGRCPPAWTDAELRPWRERIEGELGLPLEQILDVAAGVARKAPEGIQSPRYLTAAMQRRAGELAKGPGPPLVPIVPPARRSEAEEAAERNKRVFDAAMAKVRSRG